MLQWLRSQDICVDGYLSHKSFIMDKSVVGNVDTTEGIILFERAVTSKVIEGSLEDWPEVDPPSVSLYLCYEYTFNHGYRSENKFNSKGRQVGNILNANLSLPFMTSKWNCGYGIVGAVRAVTN